MMTKLPSQDVLERLLTLRPVAERQILTHHTGTPVADPATEPLRVLLFGKEAVEGEVCPNEHSPTYFQEMGECATCHGTGRIGASPAIEGCLVACPRCATLEKQLAALEGTGTGTEKGLRANLRWHKASCTGYLLHPHLAWALDNGRDGMACGFVEDLLRAANVTVIWLVPHSTPSVRLWIDGTKGGYGGNGSTRFDALINAIEQAWKGK